MFHAGLREYISMGIIPFIIFIILLYSKTDPDNRHADAFKYLIFACVAFGIVASILGPLGIIAVIGIISYLVINAKKDKESKKREEQYGWDPQRWDKENRPAGAAFEKKQHAGQTAYSKNNAKDDTVKYDPLPKAIRKRKKIIHDFNDKYNLCLTDSQIQNITNSSYMSEIWNREVQSMNQKYNVVYEWFPGRTQWLRVYMYVFHVQEITSDIRQQETIAAYAFEEVFRFFDTLPSMTMAEKIDRINSEFFTSFDDATFMIAYRFLESRGLKHNLGGPDVIKDEDNIDELLKKYSTVGSGL